MARRALRAAFLALLASARLPAGLSALTPVKPVRWNAAARLGSGCAPLAATRLLTPAAPVSLIGTSASRVHRVGDLPEVPEGDEAAGFDYIPIERIKTGYVDLSPRRKIGFLRQGESDVFEPTQWAPRRKIGFLRRGESPLFDPEP